MGLAPPQDFNHEISQQKIYATLFRIETKLSTRPFVNLYRSSVAVSNPRETIEGISSVASAASRSSTVANSAGDRGINTGQQS